MAEKLQFDLVSPERQLLSEEVDMVTLPGTEGDFGVLFGHAPVLSTLRSGLVQVTGGTEPELRLFVRGGFAEVNANRVTVLAEEAIVLSDLDMVALELRIKNTEEDLAAAKNAAEREQIQATIDHLRQVRAAV